MMLIIRDLEEENIRSLGGGKIIAHLSYGSNCTDYHVRKKMFNSNTTKMEQNKGGMLNLLLPLHFVLYKG